MEVIFMDGLVHLVVMSCFDGYMHTMLIMSTFQLLLL